MTGTALQRFAAAVVSRPFFYDLVQNLAGRERVAGHLRAAAAGLPQGRVLDVGSASGGLAERLGLAPVCLDLDPRPLLRLRRSGRARSPVAGDAASLPFPGRAFELTLCVMVFHHLDDRTVSRVVPELSRVTAGHLLFLEPLLNEGRGISRWLWRYDRGRHPRGREELLAALASGFQLAEVSEFTVYHEYLLCVARPRSPSTGP